MTHGQWLAFACLTLHGAMVVSLFGMSYANMIRGPLEFFFLHTGLFLLGAIASFVGMTLSPQWKSFLAWCAVYCLAMMFFNGWVTQQILEVA